MSISAFVDICYHTANTYLRNVSLPCDRSTHRANRKQIYYFAISK
uniref:Uncharacterized protein n=1 Tax=Anopheles quadriannulatus TaxID=34691 RepID=A0A182XU43_ANOQN